MPINNTAPAGPGAFQDKGVAPKPALEGASEYEYVSIFNPLSVDFIGMVGVTRPVNVPFQIRKSQGNVSQLTTSEQDVARNYGLSLKNPDHQGRMDTIQRVTLPSGKTIKLIGSEAKVIVGQLVNEIMAREGNKLMMADPYQRSLVEDRVIIERGSVNDILGRGPITVQSQVREAVDQANKEMEVTENAPTEFPALTTPEPITLTTNPPAVSEVARAFEAITDSSDGSSEPSSPAEPKVRRKRRSSAEVQRAKLAAAKRKDSQSK